MNNSYTNQERARGFHSYPTLNRYKDVECYDRTRIYLKDHEYDYIHAEKIVEHECNYIVTQGPMSTTINDFWLMCAEQDRECIVQLCQFTENGETQCEKYHPDNEGETKKYGDVEVKLVAKKVHPMRGVAWNVLEVKDNTIRQATEETHEMSEVDEGKTYVDEKIHTMNHILVPWWSKKWIPDDPKQTVELHKWLDNEIPKYCGIVAICNDGAGRSATFAAISYVNKMFTVFGIMDLETAIDTLKTERVPNAMRTAEEYLFLCACLVYWAMIDGLLGYDLAEPFLLKYREYVREHFRN